MSDDEQTTLDLPGLAPIAGGQPPALVTAVRATIEQLHRDGHINAIDVGKVQLAIELAEVIALKRSSGRASTVGNDARVLMEILDAFVVDADEQGDDMLRAAMDEWSERVRKLGLPPIVAPSQ